MCEEVCGAFVKIKTFITRVAVAAAGAGAANDKRSRGRQKASAAAGGKDGTDVTSVLPVVGGPLPADSQPLVPLPKRLICQTLVPQGPCKGYPPARSKEVSHPPGNFSRTDCSHTDPEI